MIYTYGITQQGTYHVKHDIVCQDAHNIIKCDDSYAIAAVADGLGSEEHSDIASQMAARISTEYCAENIKDNYSEEQILEVIRDSFALAQSKIEQIATENGHDLDQYDTTLSLAVFKNDALYYGHSGDSGIVALTSEGLYKKVVEQQRDDEGCVFPLYFGDEKWVFGKFPEPVVSVFLATDGMFETLFPVYIRNEPVNIYVALARYFMGPDSLHIEEHGENYVKEKVSEFMNSIPDTQVNDDKTVVVLVNPTCEMKMQDAEYYAEPNWEELKRKYEDAWKRAAYPHLFKDAESGSDESRNDAEADIPPKESTEIEVAEDLTVEQISEDLSGNDIEGADESHGSPNSSTSRNIARKLFLKGKKEKQSEEGNRK